MGPLRGRRFVYPFFAALAPQRPAAWALDGTFVTDTRPVLAVASDIRHIARQSLVIII
jgi:hypothetical protein